LGDEAHAGAERAPSVTGHRIGDRNFALSAPRAGQRDPDRYRRAYKAALLFVDDGMTAL
jgi:hypothetical protein